MNPAGISAGRVVVETLGYDGGREVTVYVPSRQPEAIIYAGDGELVAPWGGLLEGHGLPATVVVGTHRLADETLRIREYSPGASTAQFSFDPERFAALCAVPPAIHRFPGSMAARLQELARIVAEEYDGDAARLWQGVGTGQELLKRIQALPGFGKQKAQIFVALLAKQLGVRPEGWEKAVGAYAEDGYRSVADVVDGISLQKVRAFKQEAKAAKRAADAERGTS